jgi:hypothetical protein
MPKSPGRPAMAPSIEIFVAPSRRAASSWSSRTSTATVSPGRIAAWFLTAPVAVVVAQPRRQDSSSGSPGGRRKTSVAGTAANSARPPMLYVASTEPSARRSRLVPS